MKTMILSALAGSLLAVAPMAFSQPVFGAALKRPNLNDADLVVHEWGTFTALQGSNGQVVDGMQHEEEHLPPFVHLRDLMNEPASRPVVPPPVPINPRPNPCMHGCKGIEPTALFELYPYPTAFTFKRFAVTQKMETPVLYFYSKNEVPQVNVTVNFPQGIISQYYPAPTSFSPGLYGYNVSSLANGQVKFDFTIAPEAQMLEIPAVNADSVYAPSREVASNYIRTSQQENEKLIFYRGLGDFSTSIVITSDDGGIYIRNNSNEATSGGILFYTDGAVFGGFVDVSTLAPQEVRRIDYSQIDALKENPAPTLIARASAVLVQKLEASGLFHDEAVAMANTWKNSYFKKPGLRFLHILPRSETEALLPLRISPTPTDLKRTLVGRVEIFTRRDEQSLISQVAELGENYPLENLGRLAEAKLRRIQQLVPAGFKTDIDKLIEKAQYAE